MGGAYARVGGQGDGAGAGGAGAGGSSSGNADASGSGVHGGGDGDARAGADGDWAGGVCADGDAQPGMRGREPGDEDGHARDGAWQVSLFCADDVLRAPFGACGAFDDQGVAAGAGPRAVDDGADGAFYEPGGAVQGDASAFRGGDAARDRFAAALSVHRGVKRRPLCPYTVSGRLSHEEAARRGRLGGKGGARPQRPSTGACFERACSSARAGNPPRVRGYAQPPVDAKRADYEFAVMKKKKKRPSG